MEKKICLTNAAGIARASELIRAGELVAFPTETVYGLGANALDRSAIEKIYAAKGRPSSSPLIVHVSSVEMAKSLVREWPEQAEQLARIFWPGPLTLVLPKQPRVPDELTAGLDTVGIRMPAHPMAQALIAEAGVPIAAPSANRFTELSPTSAEHVRESLGDQVAMILDGGRTTVGIESTVLSLAGPHAVLLRPGMVTQQEIEAVIGPVQVLEHVPEGAHASPGLHRRHYSPRTPLILIEHGQAPFEWPRDLSPNAQRSARIRRCVVRTIARSRWPRLRLDRIGKAAERSGVGRDSRSVGKSSGTVMSDLVHEIDTAETPTPALWSLGTLWLRDQVRRHRLLRRSEFVLARRTAAGSHATKADLILCTNAHSSHMDPQTLLAMLNASPRAKVVLPKSTAEHAVSWGFHLIA